jgi:hypothetical protein
MARRLKNSEESKHRSKSQKHTRRSENNRSQRLLVILACEGTKTERYYFDAMFKILKDTQKLSTASCVFATHQHTNPTGVLSDLLNFQGSNGTTYKDYDHRWIVIDRDEERCNGGGHTLEDFNNAILQASQKRPKIKVAWSNPSFEIWYLLHFQYRTTAIHRDDVIISLSEILGKTYQKNDPGIYDSLQTRLNDAIRNATKLLTEATTPPADTNPGTMVHELVNLLIQLQVPEKAHRHAQPAE